MKKSFVILSLILVAVFALTACGPSEDGLPLEVSIDQAYEKYEEGVYLLDVRTQAEWDEAHVPNAVLIPLDQLPDRIDEVPADQEVIVMCRSGNRSLSATQLLRGEGFEMVQSVSGGISQWAAKGYPVTFGE